MVSRNYPLNLMISWGHMSQKKDSMVTSALIKHRCRGHRRVWVIKFTLSVPTEVGVHRGLATSQCAVHLMTRIKKRWTGVSGSHCAVWARKATGDMDRDFLREQLAGCSPRLAGVIPAATPHECRLSPCKLA